MFGSRPGDDCFRGYSGCGADAGARDFAASAASWLNVIIQIVTFT
jgi:hypothetical protein